jgi:hypothetical protein
VKIERFHFQIRKKSPNLGNGREKTKIRKEAVLFPKPKYEKNLVFGFGNEIREGLMYNPLAFGNFVPHFVINSLLISYLPPPLLVPLVSSS